MNYITMKEFAKKWGVSISVAEQYLREGRVSGAIHNSDGWLVPANVPLPGNRRIKAFMPIWRPFVSGESALMIDSLEDEEEKCAAIAGHYYFQARYAEACREAQKCLHSESPEICASAMLVYSMASVPLGDMEATLKNLQMLAKAASEPIDGNIQVIYEYIAYLVRVFFHEGENRKPVFPECFSVLPEGLLLYGLYAYAHDLYLSGNYDRALGVAESALIVAADRYPSVCIYLYLVASIAAMNLSMLEQADSFFQCAWKLAEPEGYIQPFAEHHGLLQGQVEKFFRSSSQEVYDRISERVVDFSRGWMKIHNIDSKNKVTDQLTPFEFAIGMMAAKGKSNQEIASYQNISPNTVKFHLSVIYQKLGITKRSELVQYLNK